MNCFISGLIFVMKFYLEFLIEFENVKVCYGVGYELVIVDVSWVFLVVF